MNDNVAASQESRHLLQGLSRTDQEIIRGLCTARAVRKKEEIVSQGSVGRTMFMVEHGHLKVSIVSSEGKEISFGVLGPGDYFGELSMLDGRRRSATVKAIGPGQLLVLDFSDYQRLISDNPGTATRFLTRLLVLLASRLRATDELYQDSVFLDVSARLAKFLLGASSVDPGSGQRVVDIALSQYELGTLVNASRESVNKQLRDWEQQGIVRLDRGKIALVSVDILEERASGDHLAL